jgi:hypothetical protein
MHFCICGADEYVCQMCGGIFCSKDYKPVWRKLPRGSSGNMCPSCYTLEDRGLRSQNEIKVNVKDRKLENKRMLRPVE